MYPVPGLVIVSVETPPPTTLAVAVALVPLISSGEEKDTVGVKVEYPDPTFVIVTEVTVVPIPTDAIPRAVVNSLWSIRVTRS